jgi:hypothetical protein
MDLQPKQESFNLLGVCADVDFSAISVGNILKCKTVTPRTFEFGAGDSGLVGLDKVTNDLQAKQDFTGYNLKSPPVDNDWVLINDSEDSYKIKKVKVVSLENAYMPDIDMAIDLSAAEFSDLYANPLLIIDAPGAGKIIEIIWAAVHMHYGTIPWSCGSTTQQFVGIITPYQNGIYSPQECFNGVAEDYVGLFLNYGYSFLENLPIYIWNDGTYLNGDSDMTFHIKYRVRSI